MNDLRMLTVYEQGNEHVTMLLDASPSSIVSGCIAFLCEVGQEWNLKHKGQPLPYNRKALEALPMELVLTMFMKVVETVTTPDRDPREGK